MKRARSDSLGPMGHWAIELSPPNRTPTLISSEAAETNPVEAHVAAKGVDTYMHVFVLNPNDVDMHEAQAQRFVGRRNPCWPAMNQRVENSRKCFRVYCS